MAVTPLAPERFREVLSAESLARFERTIARGREVLDGRTLWTVNSTAQGGGVAEMLRSLIGYVRGAGIDARWMVIGGDADFFRITKRLHNRLHGADDGGELGERERAVYERRCARTRPSCWRPGSVQLRRRAAARPADRGDDPAAGRGGRAGDLARAHRARHAQRPRTRRLALPDPLRRACGRATFLAPRRYAWDGLDPDKLTVISPSIDAFSPKNQAMPFTGVTAVLRAAGLAADHHHPSRAVFERLDGSTGRVLRSARMIEENALAARHAAGRPGVALGPPQGPARRARRLRRAHRAPTRTRTSCSRART